MRLIIVVSIAATLAGCDQTITIPPPVKPALTKAYEEPKFDCTSTNTGVKCDVKSGALDKSGRWVTATFWINDGAQPSAQLSSDGEEYYSTYSRAHTWKGEQYATIELKGDKGSAAIIESASGGRISLEIIKPDGQRLLNTSL